MAAPGPNYIRLLESAAARRIPLSVLAELTYRCVYRCPHCCLWPRGGRRAELDAAAWKDIFAQLAGAGTLFLVLSGGEPFLREDFYELLGAAVDLRFQVRVFPTGTPWGRRTSPGWPARAWPGSTSASTAPTRPSTTASAAGRAATGASAGRSKGSAGTGCRSRSRCR